MQWRAVIWILGAFCTSSSVSIKAITRLIPIVYYLWKLSGRNQLHIATLSNNHGLKELLEKIFALLLTQYYFSLDNLMSKQQVTIKSSIVNTNSYLNGIFPSFNSLNREFHPGNRLVNFFSDCFSFHKDDYSSEDSKSH